MPQRRHLFTQCLHDPLQGGRSRTAALGGEIVRTLGRTAVVLLAATTFASLAACSPPEKKTESNSSGAATATSAAALGGMDALVAAAKKEGQLNVIALPPDWANYGEIIKAFGDKYGIKVNSAQPDAASQDEINAAKQLDGRPTAPDVFDLGQAVEIGRAS